MLQLAVYLAALVGIYATVVIPLNLMTGYTGLMTVAPAAYFAIGAYAVAIATTTLGISLPAAVAIGIVLAAAAAIAIAVPFLRLRDEHFMIATLAFQVIVSSVLLGWDSVTQGPRGISGVPRPTIFGLTFDTYESFAGLTALIAVLAFLTSYRISTAPMGLLLRGIREDEVAVEALGKDVRRLKVYVSVYAAVWASVGGALFASLISAIAPSPFGLNESILLLSIVIVGGSGNLLGPVLGAAVLVPLPEILRFLQVPASVGAEARDILYGLLLVLFMRFRQQGIIGERTTFRDEPRDAGRHVEATRIQEVP